MRSKMLLLFRENKFKSKKHRPGLIHIFYFSTLSSVRSFRVALFNILQDEDSIREYEFIDHVILVLRTHSESDSVGLVNFITPLRSSSIPTPEMKSIVLHVDQNWIAREWTTVANFPKLYVYPVSNGRRYVSQIIITNCRY